MCRLSRLSIPKYVDSRTSPQSAHLPGPITLTPLDWSSHSDQEECLNILYSIWTGLLITKFLCDTVAFLITGNIRILVSLLFETNFDNTHCFRFWFYLVLCIWIWLPLTMLTREGGSDGYAYGAFQFRIQGNASCLELVRERLTVLKFDEISCVVMYHCCLIWTFDVYLL